MNEKAIFVGDTQFPWVNPRSLNAVYEIISTVKPKYVVQIGDLYDFLSFSPFPYKRSFISVEDEVHQAASMAARMWDMVAYLAPQAELFQIKGNHDERPIKRIRKRAPEFELFVQDGIDKLFRFPGVTALESERDELVIQLNDKPIRCFHGFKLKQGDHLADLRCDLVFGHTHYGWVHTLGLNGTTICELNCGYIANKYAFPLSFTKLRSTQKWTQGLGLWDMWGPRFIPFGWD